MLHIKFRGNRTTGTRVEDFKFDRAVKQVKVNPGS